MIWTYITYGIVALFIGWVMYHYTGKLRAESRTTAKKVHIAKDAGTFEPVSLYPHIDFNHCIGSGACYKACPEEDVLGIINGRGTLINATSCIGHGACFTACPTDAITLRIGTEQRGVELPHVTPTYETNVPGIYIAGELGGMGLIKNSTEQGIEAVKYIAPLVAERKKGLAHQLVIIGAGPAGIGAALQAKQMGVDALVVEQESLGGAVFSYPRGKVVMTKPMDLPGVGKIKLVNTSKEELLGIWQEAVESNNIALREHCKVEAVNPKEHHIEVVNAKGEVMLAGAVLLAIGRRGSPRKLGVPGELSTKVAYKLIEPERIQSKHVLVVGGGDSAVENALLLAPHNKVTLSYRKAAFGRVKPKNRAAITAAIEAGQLDVVFNSNVSRIESDAVMLDVQGEKFRLDNELVYIFAGGELPGQFLKNIGVTVEEHHGKTLKKHKY